MANNKFSRKPQREGDGPVYAIESRLNVLPKPLMFLIVRTTVTKQGMSEDAFSSRWSIWYGNRRRKLGESLAAAAPPSVE